jgi:iron complex transport system ATP-binding protein
LHAGIPESLVLEGRFEAAFAAEGITFDPSSGAFRIVEVERGEIAVSGDGLAALWTKRALERLGFHVSAVEGSADISGSTPPGNALVQVEVTQPADGGPLWRLTSHGAVRQFADLESVLEPLRHVHLQ